MPCELGMMTHLLPQTECTASLGPSPMDTQPWLAFGLELREIPGKGTLSRSSYVNCEAAAWLRLGASTAERLAYLDVTGTL